MNHNPSVRKTVSMTLCAAGKKHCAHRGLETDADSFDVGFDIVHRVDNGETVINGATGRVNIKFNRFFRVFVRQKEELGDDEIRGMGVYVFAEEDNSVG